jgi:hypothetical protein
VHFIQDMAGVMQSVGSLDDLAYSDASSHTSWTMDDGHMSFHLQIWYAKTDGQEAHTLDNAPQGLVAFGWRMLHLHMIGHPWET